MNDLQRGHIIVLLDEFEVPFAGPGGVTHTIPFMSFVQVVQPPGAAGGRSELSTLVRYEVDGDWARMELDLADLGRRWTITSDVWPVDSDWNTRKPLNEPGTKSVRISAAK